MDNRRELVGAEMEMQRKIERSKMELEVLNRRIEEISGMARQ